MRVFIILLFLIGCSKTVDYRPIKGNYTSSMIKDYSNIHQSFGSYLLTEPSTTNEASEIIRLAYLRGFPLRFSGSNHSQNGNSLPKKNEILIRSLNLNEVTFLNEHSIKVGAGVNLWYLNQHLKSLNLKLKVFNDGGAAPSLGGYISAGGISSKSRIFGGFWENVLEITLIIKNGEILNLRKSHPLFSWVFGSMGQLGFITSAQLEIIPVNPNKKISIPEKKIKIPKNSESKPRRSLYWYNLFLAKDQLEKGKSELDGLKKKYSKYFRDLEIYHWPIKFKSFNPPLVFSKNESFICLGIFSLLKDQYGPEVLREIDREFFAIVQKNRFGRYIQAERDIRPEGLKILWGGGIYDKFHSLKKFYDPKSLFNQGSVFKRL